WLTLTIEDDDRVGIEAEPSEGSVLEGETFSYTLRLASQPSAPVEVVAEVTAGERCTVSGAQRVTPATWEAGASFTVTTTDDAIYSGDASCTVRHTVSGTGSGYAELAAEALPTVTLAVLERQLPDLLAEPEALEVLEGATGRYTLRLAMVPLAPLTVAVTSEEAICSPVPASITLDNTNWESGVQVEVQTLLTVPEQPGRTCTLEHQPRQGEANWPAVTVTLLETARRRCC
ncbi:MAG: hypothetical protein HC915_09210, partial [Anaerolineae bacterium]|nr:hypothetical protein [Anaerolineae bacterium]